MKVELAFLVLLGITVVHASSSDVPKADVVQLQMSPSSQGKDGERRSMNIEQHPMLGQPRRSYNDVLKDHDRSTVPRGYGRRRYTLPQAPTKRPPKKKGKAVPAIPHRGKHSARSRLSITGTLG